MAAPPQPPRPLCVLQERENCVERRRDPNSRLRDEIGAGRGCRGPLHSLFMHWNNKCEQISAPCKRTRETPTEIGPDAARSADSRPAVI
eukprot:158483-Prymnesium_polylepis.1